MKSLCVLFLALMGFMQVTGASEKVQVDTKKSQIVWIGKKVTGEHTGTVTLKEGTLELNNNNKLSGGQFEVDMESINCTDLSGEWREKLINHLKSPDFFDTKGHKTASLKIKDVQFGKGGLYNVVADLTIKGVTKPVLFDVSMKENNNGMVFESTIVFDRTEYGVKYNSGKFFDPKALAEKMIEDKVTLKVSLVAKTTQHTESKKAKK